MRVKREHFIIGLGVVCLYVLLVYLSGGHETSNSNQHLEERMKLIERQMARSREAAKGGQTTQQQPCHEEEAQVIIDELRLQIVKLEGQLAAAQTQEVNQNTNQDNAQSGKIVKVYPKPITPIKMRNELGDICRRERFEVGIEIGVSRGQYAQQILKRWSNFKKYYLVDVWAKQENYHDVSNLEQGQMEVILAETHSRMDKYRDRVVFVKGFSNVVVDRFQNDSIDFIYVDARHDYKGVYQDLTLYWPKLKEGGIIAGHDYLDQDDLMKVDPRMDWTINGDGTRTVDGKASRAAAEDFALAVGRQMTITYKDETNGNFPTFYMRK